MAEVIMPKMGDAMTEGKVLRWIKHSGDAVKKGEPIAEIETDKVNVEIEAEWDGTLAQVLVGEGQVAAVGAPIAVIARPGEAAPQPSAAPAQTAPASPAPAPAGPAQAKPAPAAPEAKAAAPEAATTPPGAAQEAPTQAPAAAQPAASGEVRASPLARRLAEQHGVALDAIKGTGPDGRITREDVEATVAAAQAPAAPAAARAAEPAPAPGAVREVSLSRMRATIARRMTESKQRAPHFYVSMTVHLDSALALRRQINDGAADDQKVSVNDLIVKAAALALEQYPNLNASFTEKAILLSEDINISIGVALPEGLIAPTLYYCNRKSLWQIAAESKALAERARAGRLRPEDLAGGTFTISNLGMLDVDVFTAIINPPQAAILAVGSARPQPIVENGQVTVATLMQVTVSADHRITDGAEAAKFLGALRRLLENPVWLVATRPG